MTGDAVGELKGDIDDMRIIKRTGTMPDHDGLPLTGKTITLRGGMFENAHNYVTNAENLIPYPYKFAKTSPRLGISFYNIGRLLYISGTSTASQNFAFTQRVPLPEGVNQGDSLTFRVFSTEICPSSFSVRVYFYDESGHTTKNNITATDYEISKTFSVPDGAVSMECILYMPAAGDTIDAVIMPVLLRSGDTIVQYDPMADGTFLTIPAAFDGASRLSSFPCDVRVSYPLRTQVYIDDDRSCVTPEAFGAEGNGNTDDTEAFCAALAYAQEKGIAFRAYRRYKLSSPVRITKSDSDVEIHELIYTGTGVAIQIENSNIKLTTHIVRSNMEGVALRSDSSAILCCELHLGCVYAKGHALNVVPSNYQISIVSVWFDVLDAGSLGNCVNYDTEGMASSVYCTEFVYYGGIVQNGQWGFYNVSSNVKLININIENNVYGGMMVRSYLYTFGLRIVEDMRDLPGPLLKINGMPKGTLHCQTPIDLSKIDLSEAIDYYTTENAPDLHKTMYNGSNCLKIVNDVSNTLYQNSDGTTAYYASTVLGRNAVVIGKKIVIQRLYETKRVVTESEMDMTSNAVNLNVTKLIPTIYEAGAAMSTVRLHPSFASFGHDTVTVIQTDEYKIALYDCEGHLVFDGSTQGEGTYRLRAYHDYDDNAGTAYAENFPIIDYSREKWMLI